MPNDNNLQQPMSSQSDTNSVMPPLVTDDTPQTVENTNTQVFTTNNKPLGSNKGKIIATILGLFLLVGGVGAGLFLVDQNQDIREKAAGEDPCGSGLACSQSSSLIGSTACTANSLLIYCCPSGMVISNDKCVSTSDISFTCTQNDANQRPSCLNVSANWEDGSCGLNICPRGDTNGDGGCSLADNGATFEVGNCFSDILPKTASLTASTCYQSDTIVSMANNTWCDLTSPPSICTGYASNLSTCGGCGPRYYCGTNGSIGATLSLYDPSSNLECNKVYPTSCESNLSTYMPGQTTGKCYATEQQALADPVCAGNPPTATSRPTTPAITVKCQSVKAYSESWTALSTTDLYNYKTNDKVNFCVTGYISYVDPGSDSFFDMARFRINGTQYPDTTMVRPGTTDFCYQYTIPSGVSNFEVIADIHHTTLGWK